MVDKKTISVAVILSILLSGGISLIGDLNQDNLDGAYYCESRALIMNCDKLSSGIGTRCYFEDTYKKCSEGWIQIESEMELQNGTTHKIGLKFMCTSEKCIEIEK